MYSLPMSNEVDLPNYLKTKNEIMDSPERAPAPRGEFGHDYGTGDDLSRYVGGWRQNVGKMIGTDDQNQILSVSTGRLQAHLLTMAFEGEREATRLAATQYALEQAGLGAIKNAHIHNTYDGIPTEQLLAMFQDKATRLADAGISMQDLLTAKTNSGNIVDAEIITDEEVVVGDR